MIKVTASKGYMPDITYKKLAEQDIESLREMCNALMGFQAENAKIRPDVMASMHFDNRLKPEFAAAQRKRIDVAYAGQKAVGFSFATITSLTEQALHFAPPWAAELSGEGFFPSDYKVPTTIGTVKLLYVDPGYRGMNIGEYLTESSLQWIAGKPDVKDKWVYVANGNEVVGQFYEKFGFQYSHAVYSGFIHAYCLKPSL